MRNAREKKVDKTNNLRNGRMVVFDWSKCSASLMSSKLKLGLIATADGVKKADNMSSDILKVCNYFTRKKLFGFLSANPGSYNIRDVVEFYNNATFEGGCIKSSVKDTTISFNLKKFADIFELPHEGDVDTDIDDKLLKSMFLEKKAKGKAVAFRTSMSRNHFNNAYNILTHILTNIVEGRTGHSDSLSKARLSVMYHVYKDLSFNWGEYIFKRLVENICAFQLEEVDGFYGPTKSVGFGLRILCILKHFKVTFSEKYTLGRSKFIGECDLLGVPRAKRERARKRKAPEYLDESDDDSEDESDDESEDESGDVHYLGCRDNKMHNFSRCNVRELQQTPSPRRPSRVIEDTRIVRTVKEVNTKLPGVYVQHETITRRSGSDSSEDLSDDCSYDTDTRVPSRTEISTPVLNFTDVKNFKEFKIYANGEILDVKIPLHYRVKYYEMCNSQKAFLHEHVKCCGNLVAGMIEQTVTIAEATKAANFSTSVQDLESMEKDLKSFEDLGMNVGFLRGRIIKLGNLISEHQTVTESKKIKLSQIEDERTALREEMSKLEELTKILRARKALLVCFEADVDTLGMKRRELEFVIKDVVDSPW